MTLRLFKLSISMFVWIIDYIYRNLQMLFGRTQPPTCIVLYYHIVDTGERKQFARQMDDILRNAIPVRADSKDGFSRNKHYVAVTFDDGYVCVLENAVPELVIRNIPFTIFVPTGYLDKQPGWIKDESRREYRELVMNGAQLSDLSKMELATIGSHCISHANLRMIDDDAARTEILKSKQYLETIILKNVKLLSFPHGAYSDRCIEFAYQAGYDRVFTIQPTLAFLDSDQFVIGRVSVNPGDWRVEFLLKMSGSYRWLPIAYFLKKKFFRYGIEYD